MLFQATSINELESFFLLSDKYNTRLYLCVINDDTDKRYVTHFKENGEHSSYITVLININQVPRLPFVLDVPNVPFVAMYKGWIQCGVWSLKTIPMLQ